jgi:hypothetical protein
MYVFRSKVIVYLEYKNNYSIISQIYGMRLSREYCC